MHSNPMSEFLEAIVFAERAQPADEYPPANYFEDPETKDHVLQIAITGHAAENIHITTENGLIQITATVPEETKVLAKARTYFHRKLKISDINRKFKVPENLDIAEMRATISDGMLTLHLPLTPEYKKRLEKRTVLISA